MHGAAPLTYDASISRIAQAYADQLAASGQFQHSGNKYNGKPLGENLAKWWGSLGPSDLDGSKGVNMWYDEVSLYDFSQNTFQYAAGHFTQLVWKNSQQLGIGVSQVGDSVIVVCNYFPAGNYARQFTANVSPKVR